MISHSDAKRLILDLFEEEALVIGGLVAIHEVEDDLVWRLVKNLDVIRLKTLRRLKEENPSEDGDEFVSRPDLKPHPAVEEFLMKLRRD
ncbi:MAG: hypothetical protein GTN72_14395 [Candidatus Latescibacteria bacterium]|nr:hypothetical protein [Candidatus Latescibacterota bacterium]